MKFSAFVPTLSLRDTRANVPSDYRALHDHLAGRYADTVVLSFMEIEGLVGHPLPALAYGEDWWSSSAEERPSGQARAWMEANRTAHPNLIAKKVAFERCRSTKGDS